MISLNIFTVPVKAENPLEVETPFAESLREFFGYTSIITDPFNGPLPIEDTLIFSNNATGHFPKITLKDALRLMQLHQQEKNSLREEPSILSLEHLP